MFLSIKDLKKSFGEDEYKTEVLKGIDFEIEKRFLLVHHLGKLLGGESRNFISK